jgi:hypothetical protein
LIALDDGGILSLELKVGEGTQISLCAFAGTITTIVWSGLSDILACETRRVHLCHTICIVAIPGFYEFSSKSLIRHLLPIC